MHWAQPQPARVDARRPFQIPAQPLSAALEIPVILSGGVSCIADLRAAAEPELGLAGAIVGRALYTGAIDLAEALAALGDRAC